MDIIFTDEEARVQFEADHPEWFDCIRVERKDYAGMHYWEVYSAPDSDNIGSVYPDGTTNVY